VGHGHRGVTTPELGPYVGWPAIVPTGLGTGACAAALTPILQAGPAFLVAGRDRNS